MKLRKMVIGNKDTGSLYDRCVNVTMYAMHGHGRVCLKRIL